MKTYMRNFILYIFALSAPAHVLAGCEDLSSFSTTEDEVYRGSILQAGEIRKGFGENTRMELSLDVSRINETPGMISTIGTDPSGIEEKIFENAAMKSIKSLVYDSLGSFTFPSGRLKNYMLAAPVSGGRWAGSEAIVVVSLMSDGNVEVRVILGEEGLYGIFILGKERR